MKTDLKRLTVRYFSFLLMLCLVIGGMPITGVMAAASDNWTITNNVEIISGSTGGYAKYKGLDFTYYSPNTKMKVNYGGVQSENCNGEASNGIVVTTKANRAYCEFLPTSSGVLTIQVRNASGKTGYVSRTNANNESESLGSFVPGADNVNNDFLTFEKGGTYETIKIDIDKSYKYYVCLTGSKMCLYDLTFEANTSISGNVINSGKISEYGIKFINNKTSDSTEAEVDCSANTYSVQLKPGFTYTAVLTGAGAVSYAITSDTKSFTAAGEPIVRDIKLEEVSTATLSGSITGIEEGYGLDDMVLKAVPVDNDNYQSIVIDIDKINKTYSVILRAGVEYTFGLTGVWDYEISDNAKFSISENTTKELALRTKATYSVTGDFIVSTGYNVTDYKPIGDEISDITEVKFRKLDEDNIKDGYAQGYIYDGTITDKGYSGNLRTGAYEVTFTSEKFHTVGHVVVKDAEATKNIMVGYNIPTALENVPKGNDIYVNSDGSKDYKTVREAVDAAAAKNPQSEADRVTVHIAPGTYREQVVINTPYITFINDTPEEGDAILTWYYGIGYKYYSATPPNSTINARKGYYNVEYAYDKYTKSIVEDWGTTVSLLSGATDFRAENIIFESSFNRRMTEEEVIDGVECNEKKFERKAGVDVRVTSAKERACVMYGSGDCDRVEFYKCQFLSDQDTIGTRGRMYFKDCIISGTTDYICGPGSAVFDNCELRWSGYKDKDNTGGYITAPQADDWGYLFRNCQITKSKEEGIKGYSKGYLGRPWKPGARAIYVDTIYESANIITDVGWKDMSGEIPENNYFYETGSKLADGTLINLSNRIKSKLNADNIKEEQINPLNFFKDWKPKYYNSNDDDDNEESTVKGDFDGNKKIEVKDAVDLLEYILDSGNEKFANVTELQISRSDADGDGELTAKDVALILKMVLDGQR